jgi:serine/threonine-protein kinase
MTDVPSSNELPEIGSKYTVLRVLGKGRTSIVYEALQQRLGCVVAIKLLRAELASNAAIAERFRVEAQVLAQMQHPNVVRVLDMGDTEAGLPFVVLERLWGHTVGAELRRRAAFTPDETVALMTDLLSALGSAHDLGIVHRDLNLHNLFLHEAAEGGPCLKLLDFGHAKVLVGVAENAPAPPAIPTPPDEQVGTPRTMSPEAVERRDVDTRADIYSAGIIAYWLLAGRDPFSDTATTEELFTAHVLREPEPPSRWALKPIPLALDEAILTALAKEPSARFQTVHDFMVALKQSLPPTEAEPPSRGNDGATAPEPFGESVALAPRPWPATRTGAALLVLLVAAGVLALMAAFFPAILPHTGGRP